MEKVNADCRCCGNTKVLEVDIDKFYQWKSRKLLAQNAFPHLDAADRELLISGTCGKCWIDMFGEDDEDEAC
jgi:hypothetical protein